MSIRQEIIPYTDANNLVSPCLTHGILKGSDNGPMYTSEYYVILQKLNELTPADTANYKNKINTCINEEGMLCRVPIGQDDGQEQVDDYYGVLNGCKQLKITSIPRRFLKAIFKYKGSMNNESPGTFQWDAFMPRQLQLMAAMISAAFPSWWNPIHVLIRIFFWHLYLYTAIIIATSCIGTDPSSTDPRRLSWHLVQTVSSHSLLCRLASYIWYWRLYKDYGPLGMQAVAKLYYQDNHPFQRYWVTK